MTNKEKKEFITGLKEIAEELEEAIDKVSDVKQTKKKKTAATEQLENLGVLLACSIAFAECKL